MAGSTLGGLVAGWEVIDVDESEPVDGCVPLTITTAVEYPDGTLRLHGLHVALSPAQLVRFRERYGP